MALIKNRNEIRKSDSIKGFRSCRHSTAVPTALLDRGRMQAGEARRLWQTVKKNWLGASLRVSAAHR